MTTKNAATQDATPESVPVTFRVLVTIASFGTRNLGFLNRLIEQYRHMAMAVDVVVLSDAPKDLPVDVEVVVGLPSPNPHSLPFAHKRLFEARLNSYDLFIYSEDDIDVRMEHVEAFISATRILEKGEVAGFLRYERDIDGAIWMPDAHGRFHWNPETLRRGDHLFAEFTNEHSALYILTQAQLRLAIASGGFIREPYEGKYSMLEAAATDPYTSCGLRRLICISQLDRFLVHHMSDRYAGRMGLPITRFRHQLDALQQISAGVHPVSTLGKLESCLKGGKWSKSFYEAADPTVLQFIPPETRTVLSIGCGWGAVEAALVSRGAEVTVVPLDSVVGAAAACCGLTPVYGSLEESLERLSGTSYDCVLVSNLIHLQLEPNKLFDRCATYVKRGGVLVVVTPNFDRIPTWFKRLLRVGDHAVLGDYYKSGITVLGPHVLRHMARRVGLRTNRVAWFNHALPGALGLEHWALPLGRCTAHSCLFRAQRPEKN